MKSHVELFLLVEKRMIFLYSGDANMFVDTLEYFFTEVDKERRP